MVRALSFCFLGTLLLASSCYAGGDGDGGDFGDGIVLSNTTRLENRFLFSLRNCWNEYVPRLQRVQDGEFFYYQIYLEKVEHCL